MTEIAFLNHIKHTQGFTELWLQNMPTPDKRRDIREPNGRGFAIRVTPAPDGSPHIAFCLLYKFDGKNRRLTLGAYHPGQKTLAAARKAADQARALIARGDDPALAKRDNRADQRRRIEAARSDREAPRMAELFELYRRGIESTLAPSTVNKLRRLFHQLPAEWRRKKVAAVTPAQVSAIIRPMVDAGTPTAANARRNLLRDLFRLAVTEGMRPDNPADHTRLQDVDVRIGIALDDDQIVTFWRMLDDIAVERTTAQVLRFILVTGQRPGEVCALPWSEIDFEQKLWRLPAERQKVKRKQAKLRRPETRPDDHLVPLSDLALRILAEQHSSNPFVFPSSKRRGQSANTVGIANALRRNHLRGLTAGLPALTPHDLRRTCRTGLERLGVDPVVSERVIGHQLQGVLKVYNRHSYAVEKRSALDAWARHLQTLTGEADPRANVVPLR